MSVLSNCAWKAYRAARVAIRWSGLRKSPAGRACLAGANRAATSAMHAVLSARSRPFLVHGHKMYLANSQSPSLGLALSMMLDHYEPLTTRLLEHVVGPGMTFVDVGAHVGYFTLLAARLVGPGGRVYAFEPDPSSFALLERNIALNSHKNIVPVPRAVSSHSGRATLFLDQRGSDRNTLLPESGRSSSIEIDTVALDEFFELECINKVDVLKIDAEGAEDQVIRGMTLSAAAGKVRTVVFEFTPFACESSGTAPSDFLRQIRDLGFELHQFGPAGETLPLPDGGFGPLIGAAWSTGSCNLIASWNRPL